MLPARVRYLPRRARADVVLGDAAIHVVRDAMMARLFVSLAVLGLLLAIVMVHSRALAEVVPSVQLVLPAQPDSHAREVAARLRGELSAAGFAVVAESISDAATPRVAMEESTQLRDTTVVIFVRSTDDGKTIDAWISERILGAVAYERLSVAMGEVDAPRRLAVQVAELLRGRVAESALEKKPAPAQPVQAEASGTVDSSASQPGRWQLIPSAGVLTLWRPHAWELSPMPSLGVALVSIPEQTMLRSPAWGVALMVAALGPKIERDATAGTASARQGLATCEAHVRASSQHWLTPELAGGIGVYGVAVHGRARAPFQAHDHVSYSPLLSARLGLDARLLRRLSLRLSGYVLNAPIKTSLRIADQQVARAGGFMLAGGLEMRIWL